MSKKTNEKNLRNPQVYNKRSNIWAIGVPRVEKERKTKKVVKEVVARNSLNSAKDEPQNSRN